MPPADPIQDFRDRYYLRLNQRRLEHLASLNLPIAEKRVVEFGAGIGDHTPFFLSRACTVLVTDARESNLAEVRRRFAKFERVSIQLVDFDTPPAADKVGTHDIVYCYGLLYHLRAPAVALEYLAKVADRERGMVLLETVVAYGDDDVVHPSPSQPTRSWGSMNGTGCLPTRRWVANRLLEHFPFVAMTRRQPWHEEFPTSWRNAGKLRLDGLPIGRAVWVASRDKIDNPALGMPVEEDQAR